MDPDRRFHVLIGAPLLVDHLPQAPCCVIDADQDQLDRLEQDLVLRPHAHGCELHCAVLASQAHLPIDWYRFNDPRWDGILSLSAWLGGRPNLQLRDRSTRLGTELEVLLDGLSMRVDAMQSLTVFVGQGDPLAVVEASGDWLNRIEELQLGTPEAEAIWAKMLDARLVPLGFERSQGEVLVWKRTNEAMQHMHIHQLEHQRNSLAKERDDLKCYLQQAHDATAALERQHREDLQQQQNFEKVLKSQTSALAEERDELKRHLQQTHAATAELERRHQEEMLHLKLQLEVMVQQSAARIDLIRDLLAPRLKEP